MKNFTYRFAQEKDTAIILRFIKELAAYEKLEDQVTADEETLKKWIFEKQKAEVIIALDNDEEAGYALFFHNFSTFQGRSGIYLEDLYITPKHRGKGLGIGLIKKLAQIANERDCGRFEWCCLDWNKPSIDLYLSLGAVPMNDWTIYRVEGEKLKALAEN